MPQQNDFDVSDFLSGLEEWGQETRDRALAGVKDAGQYVLGRAVDIVPLDTGALSNSGKAQVDSRSLTSVISFDTPYAVEVHENMSIPHSPGRTAKYLEIPLMSAGPEIIRLILRRMR